jgi:hypothetical protein
MGPETNKMLRFLLFDSQIIFIKAFLNIFKEKINKFKFYQVKILQILKRYNVIINGLM